MCVDCTHFRRGRPGIWGRYCDAYPDSLGIPDAIRETDMDHLKPYAAKHAAEVIETVLERRSRRAGRDA